MEAFPARQSLLVEDHLAWMNFHRARAKEYSAARLVALLEFQVYHHWIEMDLEHTLQEFALVRISQRQRLHQEGHQEAQFEE